jgi:hypothetical protein
LKFLFFSIFKFTDFLFFLFSIRKNSVNTAHLLSLKTLKSLKINLCSDSQNWLRKLNICNPSLETCTIGHTTKNFDQILRLFPNIQRLNLQAISSPVQIEVWNSLSSLKYLTALEVDLIEEGLLHLKIPSLKKFTACRVASSVDFPLLGKFAQNHPGIEYLDFSGNSTVLQSSKFTITSKHLVPLTKNLPKLRIFMLELCRTFTEVKQIATLFRENSGGFKALEYFKIQVSSENAKAVYDCLKKRFPSLYHRVEVTSLFVSTITVRKI